MLGESGNLHETRGGMTNAINTSRLNVGNDNPQIGAGSHAVNAMHRIRRYRLEGLLLLSSVALVGQLAWPSVLAWNHRPRAGAQVPQEAAGYRYLVYLPRDYEAGKDWSLLLYLHGSGGRGLGLDVDKLGGPPQLVQSGRHFPMIIASPQCPEGADWDSARLVALLDHLEERFHPAKIMATGYSMGGSGTWRLAQHAPERLAAIAPICGCGDPREASRLKNVPIWCFHGEQDGIVPIHCSQDMVDAVRAAGAAPRFTTYPNRGHDIAKIVYDAPELFDWLLNPIGADAANNSPRSDGNLSDSQ